MLQTYKDFVEFSLYGVHPGNKFTKNLSNLHTVVILVVYTGKKQEEETTMKIRQNEDYYFWCCDWCDSENRMLWTKLQDGIRCGACHRPMAPSDTKNGVVINSAIAAGLN